MTKYIILYCSSEGFNRTIFSTVCHNRLNTQDLVVVTAHISFSEWIFLYYLAKNMEPYLFTIFLGDLASELRARYNEEHDKLLADESNRRNDEKSTLKLDAAESVDEVDFRKK